MNSQNEGAVVTQEQTKNHIVIIFLDGTKKTYCYYIFRGHKKQSLSK